MVNVWICLWGALAIVFVCVGEELVGLACRLFLRRHGGGRCLASGLADAAVCQGDEGRIDLHSQPVPPQPFGGDGGGARADKRVEDDAGLSCCRSAVAGRLQRQSGGGGAGAPQGLDVGSAAGGAALLRTGGAQDALHQMLGIGGEVRPTIVRDGQLPDVARVLAQRVADGAPPLHSAQAIVGVGVVTTPGRWHPRSMRVAWPTRWLARARGRVLGERLLADGVEVEEVTRSTAEQVDDLVLAGQAVGDAGGGGVGLGPDDLVADDPAVRQQRQSQALGPKQEGLARRAFAAVGAVGVAEVEPERAGRYQDSRQLLHDGAQVLDPLVDGGLCAQLALVLVVAQPEIRWAGDDAVDAAGLERGQPVGGIAGEDGVSRGGHKMSPFVMTWWGWTERCCPTTRSVGRRRW